jgi:hypothetical protein
MSRFKGEGFMKPRCAKESVALLKMLAQSTRSVENGNCKPLRKAFKDIVARRRGHGRDTRFPFFSAKSLVACATAGLLFKGSDVGHRFLEVVTAHRQVGLPTPAERRPLGPAEQAAQVVVIQVYAPRPRRLTLRHPRHRRRDGRRDTTRSALLAVHGPIGGSCCRASS